jgi:hypothetical protein
MWCAVESFEGTTCFFGALSDEMSHGREMSWHRIAIVAAIFLTGALTAWFGPKHDSVGVWHAKPAVIAVQPNAPSKVGTIVLLTGQ